MGAEYLSHVKFIVSEAPTFFGYIISVLASVNRLLSEKILDFFLPEEDNNIFDSSKIKISPLGMFTDALRMNEATRRFRRNYNLDNVNNIEY